MKTIHEPRAGRRTTWILALGMAALAAAPRPAPAATMCAEVQIEIKQALTLERQAFDAKMEIRNGFDALSVEDVQVDVKFFDANNNLVPGTADPNNTNALFFVREDRMSNIDSVQGGTVAPLKTAEIHWLIVPAPGAGGTDTVGRVYNVGATLTYTMRGEDEVVEVIPDYILVKPMPMLTLDYFLPGQVYGDDPYTSAVEPREPFTFGLRVKNTGAGDAYNLRIESAQPTISDNRGGLLVDFDIESAEVQGRAVEGDLLCDFGILEADSAGVARWNMTASLIGRFTNFTAYYTHADELGGELTSLIENTYTHELIHDVLVDLPGRDGVLDFLARDGATVRAYESEGQNTPVGDVSASATLAMVSTGTNTLVYDVGTPAASTPFYLGKDFPQAEGRRVQSVSRADGKPLNPLNVWISRSRLNGEHPWTYRLNLFDVGLGGTYRVTLGYQAGRNRPPVLAYIGRQVTWVNTPLSVPVSATDPDGTLPMLSATNLPDGAVFTDAGNTSGSFAWTPAPGDYGVHLVRFRASDGVELDDEVVKIYVGQDGEPLNADGLPVSLANWKPQIKKVLASSSSLNSTVKWDSAQGILYRVHWSDDPYGASMSWHQLADRAGLGREETESDDNLELTQKRRYYQLTVAGEAPTAEGIWGVIRQDVRPGYTMISPPLRSDRRFDGEMGRMLAEQLTGDDGASGDKVFILQAGGTWKTLYLDGQGVWREAGGEASAYELPEGRGLFVERRAVTVARATFTGPVGNDGTKTNTLAAGWNLIGLSEGLTLPVKETFAGANPRGGAGEEAADQLVLQNANGSWRRLIFVQGWGAPYDGNWFDLSSFQIVTNKLEPGAAYYYYRQPAAGATQVEF